MESVGGKLHGLWYALGEHDGYALLETPDNVSTAAVSAALSGSGALRSVEMIEVLTVDETLDTLRKGQYVSYRAPGA